MKKIIPLVALAALSLFSCDDVKEEERWIESVGSAEVKRNVLIEDFTGQDCVNCPNAAAVVSNLQTKLAAAYGKSPVIAVAIHGGGMKLKPETNPRGLHTAQGDEYNSHWGITSWPNGMVNRKGGLTAYTAWEMTAIKSLFQPAVMGKIDIDNAYNPETRTLDVKVSADAMALQRAKVNVWLTESHILGYQLMPDNSRNLNYEHNHVFRDNITAAYGDDVTAANGKFETEYKYTVALGYGPGANNEKYYCNTDNMAVVVFFTDVETGEVLQVEEAHLAHK